MNGKNSEFEDNIKELIKSGWRLRKNPKKVRNRWYITMRNGDREKSFGRYSEEKYIELKRIQEEALGKPIIANSLIGYIDELFGSGDKSLEKFLDYIQFQRGHYKLSNCLYRQENFCYYWKWEKKPPLEMLIPPFHLDSKTVSEPKLGLEKWVVQATVQYCKLCSAFKEKV